MLIKKREGVGLKHYNDCKAFIEYSNDLDDVYEILKNTMQIRNTKLCLIVFDFIDYMILKMYLIVFDDMIADMVSNKKLQ